MRNKFTDHIFCAMDTETTGTDPSSGDRIVEVALVPIYKGKILYRGIYHSLVNPKIKIPAVIEKVHGIGNQQLQSAPDMEKVFEKIKTYMTKSIMVFHRAQFDLTFLDFAAKEVGTFLPTIRFLDTHEIAQYIFKERKTLPWLAKHYDLPQPTHRALDDAIVTAKVFLKMIKELEMDVTELVKTWSGEEW
ncbi:3'-5' exonuclease [Pseudothermotoga sp.]|uniref:3'-5' exonuclease n=1 Tax=Pseudothermotoga sp. TaxID=2033661 RepID=UPI0031F6056F